MRENYRNSTGSHDKGKFILTGSTTLRDKEKKQIHHSGAGRIARMKMYTMSLYESGDSKGQIFITDMLENKEISQNTGKVDLKTIANLIIRGGWPESLNIKEENYALLPKSYVESILNVEINKKPRLKFVYNKS